MDDFNIDSFDKLHQLEGVAVRLAHMLTEQERRMAELRKQLTDLEASRFADRCEIEIDLERWDGIRAAHVGRDLEELESKLLSAIEASARGEDVGAALFDLHGNLCCIMADISTHAD